MNVVIEYMTVSGEQIIRSHVIEPSSRYTVPVNEDVGSSTALAARVLSNTTIVAERPMYFDNGGRCGGHCAPGYKPW